MREAGIAAEFDVIFADPPYAQKESERYGVTTLVDRAAVLREAAAALKSGGLLVWLDIITWKGIPIPPELSIVGRTLLLLGTNKSVRTVTFFQRA